MSQKLCARCKADVSGKPRMKDAQGRYYCEDCVRAIKAAQSAGKQPASKKPAPPAQSNVMADLVEGAVAHMGEPCEVCQAPMAENAIICTRCGHNRQTGRNLKTRVSEESKRRKNKKRKQKTE